MGMSLPPSSKWARYDSPAIIDSPLGFAQNRPKTGRADARRIRTTASVDSFGAGFGFSRYGRAGNAARGRPESAKYESKRSSAMYFGLWTPNAPPRATRM